MGWKVRSQKLESIKKNLKERGGRNQVRWQVAQYRIRTALAARGQQLESGLNQEDFQYLASVGVLIGEAENLIIETMPQLAKMRVSLEEIRDYFIPDCSLDLHNFLNDYLKIKYNGHGTWQKFLKGEAIELDAFETICIVLGVNRQQIGVDAREVPDWKELEILLWGLNHKAQSQDFNTLATTYNNLVCFKIPQVPGKCIPLFWLLKCLLQPFDDSIAQADLDFTSLIYSNSRERLNSIIVQLGLPEKLKKQSPEAIAKNISKKILKENRNIALFFWTHDRQKETEVYELVNLLREPLFKELSGLKTQKKLLMVWIDWQTETKLNGDDFDNACGRYFASHQIPFTSQFENSDLINWTNLKKVRLFFEKVRSDLVEEDSISSNYASEMIWRESEEGQPEFLLNSVYKFCALNWEKYQELWQKI